MIIIYFNYSSELILMIPVSNCFHDKNEIKKKDETSVQTMWDGIISMEELKMLLLRMYKVIPI